MPKVARYSLLVCLAVILTVSACLVLTWLQTYRRPILHSMKSAHNGVWTNDSDPARTALLQHLPNGTDSTTAIGALTKDGFACEKKRSPLEGNVNCQLLGSAGTGSVRWIIDLEFDKANQLIGAKVAIWNISL